MYHMKNIISFENEIVLPKCMYTIKNLIEVSENVTDIKICEQVTKFLKVYFKYLKLSYNKKKINN